MRIKFLVEEDFINYKKPSLFIGFPNCSFKCDKECGFAVCQNSELANSPDINISKEKICERFINNPITEAIVFGGLEPFDSPLELVPLIDCFRRQFECEHDIVIYTGYTEEELKEIQSFNYIKETYKNIIVKFGRFIPNQQKYYDETLGVYLYGLNQYARRIS